MSIPWLCPYKAKANRVCKCVLGKRVLINTDMSGDRLGSSEGARQPLVHAPLEDIMKLNKGAILNSPKDYGESSELQLLCPTGLISVYSVACAVFDDDIYYSYSGSRWNNDKFLLIPTNVLFPSLQRGRKRRPLLRCVLWLKPKHDLEAKNNTERRSDQRKLSNVLFQSFQPASTQLVCWRTGFRNSCSPSTCF